MRVSMGRAFHVTVKPFTVPYGVMRPPQNSQIKKRLQMAWKKIPYDMLDAFEESKTMREKLCSNPSQLNAYLQRLGTTPLQKHLEMFLAFCTKHTSELQLDAVKNHYVDEKTMNRFRRDISPYFFENMHELTSADIGLILKCILKCHLEETELIDALLRRLCSRKLQFSRFASVYALECMHRFRKTMDASVHKSICESILMNIHLFEAPVLAAAVYYCAVCSKGTPSLPMAKKMVSEAIDYLIDQQVELKTATHFHEKEIMYILNALRYTHLTHTSFLEFLEPLLFEQLPSFTQSSLTSLTLGYSLLDRLSIPSHLKILDRVGNELSKLGPALTWDTVSSCASAFVRVEVLHELFFCTLSQNVPNFIGKEKAWHLATLARAYAMLGRMNDPIFVYLYEKMERRIGEFSLLDIQLSLQSYIKCKQSNPMLLQKIGFTLEKLLENYLCIDATHAFSKIPEMDLTHRTSSLFCKRDMIHLCSILADIYYDCFEACTPNDDCYDVKTVVASSSLHIALVL
ncbi:hypothetical protein IE077_002917 [Cardiosporidium cionae]|uniref:RNA-editing substrate-binding complex 6 protein domain-containing protein n=1 Tax=Cardiosporidium cionae TaxID=476202 RepID=A0ABQ7J9L2_9APIC|nr:hypothetical protein IE077_002917 [Cardiosporidium cionae]|eukprot:KAF8820687.1 hypothetical protein IE077_002917 [Cardiosporidium cionae]